MSERTVIPSPDTLIAHAGFIRAVARKLLLDDHEVDDVVQQTLLAALEKPPRRPGPLKPWLATVARNLARMRRRTEGRIDRREQVAARPESTPATSEIAARLETQRRLVEVVTALDEPYRDVVVLRFFDELPPREVAARLGIPVETVRTRTRRALEQLRGQLDRETDGGRKAWQLALLPLALPPARAQAAAATATVGILGVLGVKSIATIAAVLLAAVFLLWHETADDSGSGVARTAQTQRSNGGVSKSGPGSGAAFSGDEESAGGARGTREPADFVFRARIVDEEGEPVRGARVVTEGRGTLKTDSDGEVELDGRSGEHYLSVAITMDGYVPLKGSLTPWAETADTFVLRRGRTLRLRVLSPRGEPVVGAKCTATLEEVTKQIGNFRQIAWQDERHVASDDEGVVDLGRLPACNLTLTVVHDDFAWFSGVWEAAELEQPELEVRLAVGGTVRGVVRDEDGEPIAGATVASAVKRAKTGANGAYELKHVMANGVHVVASHPDHGPAGFGSVLGWDSDIPVRVPDGGEVGGIDFQLGPATRVRGRLVDHEGKPVAGLKLNSYIMGGAGRSNAATSGEDGRFLMGPYRLKKSTATWHVFYSKNASHAVPENLKWTLRRGETTDVGDILVETRPIIRGRVLDAAGKPVSPRLRTTVETSGSLERVGVDGSFEVQLEPGMSRIYATSNGTDTPLRSEPRIIDLKANQTIELEFRLRPTVMVSGNVLDTNGSPWRYAAVAVVPADVPDPWSEAYSAGTRLDGTFRVFVSKPGEYIVGLPNPDGKQSSRFRPDVPTRRITIETEPVTEVLLEVPAKPKKGVRVFGRVISAKTGKPVKSYSLRLIKYKFFMPDHTFYSSVNDVEGRFEDWSTKPGTYTAKISADGYSAMMTKKFAVKDKGELDLGTIKLAPALELIGLVRDSNGTPVPYAQVHLLSGLGDVGGQTYTGADGRFTIPGADVGNYNVFAVSPRHPVAILKGVSIGHGRKNNIEIEVPDTSPLTIRVKDENGRPVAGATLVWTFPEVAPFTSKEFGGYEPPSFGENKSDAEGVIRKPYTPSAPITVQILKSGFLPDSRVIRTKKGEPIEVEVVLKRR